METTTRFRIKGSNIMHETLDGEVIIIDLENGHYYSLHGDGEFIWNALIHHASIAEIISQLHEHYQCDDLKQVVLNLIEQLANEAIIVADSEMTKANLSLSLNNANERFEPPTFRKFDDMRELLVLDPIHEVDESGWPNPVEN